MSCKIYKITNSINDKVYIGQTWQALNQRFNEHKSKSKCHKLKNTFNKYGISNFKIELIVTANDQMTADYLENFWINTYDSIKSGYNIQNGGSHGKHSEETKKLISEKNKGKTWKLSDETKNKMSLAQIGNTKSLGKIKSDEHKAKIGAKSKGRKFSTESITKRTATRKLNKQLQMAVNSAKKVG